MIEQRQRARVAIYLDWSTLVALHGLRRLDEAAANILSLVASCGLHELDVESYLTDVIRVMPCWPRDRYVEVAPKYWGATRGRLDEAELKLPIGRVTVPPPSEQQSWSD